MTSDITPKKSPGQNEQALDFETRRIFSVPSEHHQTSAHEHAPRSCASHECFTTPGHSNLLSIDRSKRLSLDRPATVHTQTLMDCQLCQDITDAPYSTLATKNPSPAPKLSTNIVTGDVADNSQITTNYMQNGLDILNHFTINDSSYTMKSWLLQDIQNDPYHTLAAVSTTSFTTSIKVSEFDSDILGPGNLTIATYGSTGSVKK